ncbi:hypothetical protein BGW42_003006 [Actinomortierella wolfii]|nr:hypothetical protein BGW42_003006 [Actinomortierella wolfii]
MVGKLAPQTYRPKKSMLYTRTGDKGTSSLYNGERRAKTDRIFDALGSVDELSSSIGIAHHYCKKASNGLEDQLIEASLNTTLYWQNEKPSKTYKKLTEMLNCKQIQCNLQDIGSNIATPRTDASESKLRMLTMADLICYVYVKAFERNTNQPFRSFCLEKTAFDEGHIEKLEGWIDSLDSQLPPLRNFILPSGSEASVFLHQARSICRRAERTTIPVVEANDADESVLKYLNRLSDYLFAAARFAAKHDGIEENVYRRAKSGREATIETRTL